MSEPKVFDFAQLKLGDGAEPTESFTLICGLETIQIAEAVQTSDRQLRDCAAPATPPRRRLRVTGSTWDVTAGGLANADQLTLLRAALGKHLNWQIIPLDLTDPDVAAGVPLGTFEGQGVLTARNIATVEGGFATLDLTIAGEGELTWEPEP